MHTENAIKTAIGFFAVIVAGALLSSMLGGAFAALVASISPDFVTGLFLLDADDAIIRYAFVVGMIWGVFIGSAVSGFACFLAVVLKILRIHFELKRNSGSA